MAKRWNKALAFALALCMCAGSMNVSAWATTTTETVNNGDGTTTAITTTTEEKTDAEKNLTVTVTVEKHTKGTLEDDTTVDGVKLVRDEKRVDTTTTSEDGDLLGESWEEGGTETKKWSEEIKPGEDVPPVSAPVTPEDPTTNEKEGVTSGKVHSETEETTGDKDKSDGEWDFTTTTTKIDREVKVETSQVTVTESEKTDVDLEPVKPDTMVKTKDDGTTVIVQGYYADGTKKEGIAVRDNYFDSFGYDIVEYTDPNTNEKSYKLYDEYGKEIDFVGDFHYCGWGDYPKYHMVDYYEVYYVTKDGQRVPEGGEIEYDENGKPLTETKLIEGEDGQIIQFALQDKEGNIVYAYCVDLETEAKYGAFYDVANLEDNTYYADKNSESHIRAIVTNGYWGTNATVYETNEDGTIKTYDNGLPIPKKDENGNVVVDTTKTGSLAKIKHDMATYFSNNPGKDSEVITTDADGKQTTVKLSTLMEGLTEAEAATVTQAAIWSWSNGSIAVDNGAEGEKIIGVNGWGGKGNYDRMNALYTYLMSLESKEHTETTVIDKDTFIAKDGLNLVIGDKVGSKKATDEEGNVLKDEAGNDIINDVYEASLNFTLEFTPSRDKDDLLVTIKYTDLDGKEQSIIKRLAGTDDGKNKYIKPNEDGSYTIDGLKLSENENWTFNIELSGTQKLEQGVYVYSPVGGRGSSQTMIGMGEGTKSVDVQSSVTVNFSVAESKKVTTVREWHDESDPVWTPTEKPEYPEDDEHDDDKDIPEDPVPLSDLVDILDEEIPLANVPQTGVNNTPWSLMVVAAGLALAAVLGKKNK